MKLDKNEKNKKEMFFRLAGGKTCQFINIYINIQETKYFMHLYMHIYIYSSEIF